MKNRWAVMGVMFLVGLVAVPALAQQEERASCQPGQTASDAPKAESGKLKPQTVCPIMGGKINKDVFVDVAGYRFYACCPPCLAKIKADPAKAVATLKVRGEKPELRLVVCSKCGEIMGTAKCCKPGARKCPGCGLNKGSIGCCKDLKPPAGKQELTLCPKCGEIKGTAKCCQPDAKKCPKCGLNKGAPGCCKDLKPAGQKDIVICPGCGEVKGNDNCCKPDAKKCSKCGLNKGAPGCCKIDRFTKNKN